MTDDRVPSYYLAVYDDDDHHHISDLLKLVSTHVDAKLAPPVEIKLSIRDAFGSTVGYAHTWHPMRRLQLTTGTTRTDRFGVRAELVISPVSVIGPAGDV